MGLYGLVKHVLHPNVGWVALAAAVGLTVMGVMGIDTATTLRAGGTSLFVSKQMIFIPVALVVMLLVAIPHHRLMPQIAYPLLIVTLVLLVVVLIRFMPRSIVPVINGVRRWFDLQIILFQPSELAKIAYVLALACYLRYRENYRTLRGLLWPLLITFVPMGLIVVEPDLGTAMIFLPVMFAMLLVAGVKLRHIAAIMLIGLILMPAMYPLLQPHQKDRIISMVSQLRGETAHRADIGFQAYKARKLVGAGGVAGHGEDYGATLVRYNALPEAHNDMIFAVVCTRWGVLGGLGVIVLFLLLIGSGLAAAAMNKDPFARLVAVGVVTVIFTQMFVNIGMTIGLLPITGMTLPFVSYGGSSLVVNFAMVGLIVNIASRRPIILANPSFEFDRRSVDHVQRNPHMR